jgi:hypothetical protein
MIAMFASAAVGKAITVAEPCAPGPENYLVRDIDAVPGVFSAADLLEGIGRVASLGSNGPGPGVK